MAAGSKEEGWKSVGLNLMSLSARVSKNGRREAKLWNILAS